jgi:hypothetical protein
MSTSEATELFIKGRGPFSLDAADKAAFLETQLTFLREHHRNGCPRYRLLLEDWERHESTGDFVESYPFLPVTLFKEYELRSGEDVAVVKSSATTSASSSKIYMDKTSRKRQSRSANMIISDFVGTERRPYLVFDVERTVRSAEGFSARGAAIMALAHLASNFHFVMQESADGSLAIDRRALERAVDDIAGRPFIAYGFTWILYQAHLALAGSPLSRAHPESVFMHSGGWKKLTDIAVDKTRFNATVAAPWGLPDGRVIDFYGTVEQVGMAYPDCIAGLKHVPYWADVIIRRADSLEPAPVGESGLIQLVSCLPLAAPNHSVLTEDLGRIVLADHCRCGRRGRAFVFEGRAPKSELRGCSDVVRR